MRTRNSWLTTNLSKRLSNPTLDFEISINPYPFKKMKFDDAVYMTVKEIANNYSNLYLGLSGGSDSEFVLRAFHKHNIPITPIIVLYANEVESKYAYKVCEELKITPVEIVLTDDQFLNCLEEKIYKRFNGPAYNLPHVMFAAEYTEKNNGTLICGNHLIGDGDDLIIDDKFAFSNEWDYYIEYTYPLVNKIDLFLYTIEIMYSMFPEPGEGTWNEYKQKLFNIEYRKKIRAKYSDLVKMKLRSLLGREEDYKHKQSYEWTKSEFFEIFKNYIIK
jgi:hypothetical protein